MCYDGIKFFHGLSLLSNLVNPCAPFKQKQEHHQMALAASAQEPAGSAINVPQLLQISNM